MAQRVENFLHEDLSYKIRGACFNVHNKLGSGHKESVYQKALAKEFQTQGINFEQEKTLPIHYEKEKVGNYRPDFVAEDKIIIEIKAVEFMPKNYEVQLLNYLKATNFGLGFLINFGAPKLDIRRRVNFHQR